jgi:hypothetical protein
MKGNDVAQRVHIVLEDDMDGTAAEETVTFGLDGVTYEIDLSASNAAALRDSLAQYVANARRSSARGATSRRTGRAGRPTSGPSAAEIREWARAQGKVVSDRGRVPADVRADYDAAH